MITGRAYSSILLIATLAFLGAGGAKEKAPTTPKTKPVAGKPAVQAKPTTATKEAAAPAAPGAGGGATLQVSVVADVTNKPLPARVELFSGQSSPVVFEVPQGEISTPAPAGAYKALTYVFEDSLPILIDCRDMALTSGQAATLSVKLLEGTTGTRLLREFDKDMDLAIDRAELAAGTNPEDPSSIPGRPKLSFEGPVLGKKKGWYKGDLHVQSKYGRGTESVAEIVKRAEAAGLDFVAIADPNTLAAAQDPGLRSSSVVLIPAMLWGDDVNGYALVYGPQTYPERATTHMQAQAVSRLVQAQGGVFAAAHPCFPGLAWQWDVPFVNAVEVWCQDWGHVPPISLAALHEDVKLRTRDGKLVASIAAAADAKKLSANGQAVLFWDYELNRGRKSAPIAGSMSGSPNVPLGRPLTYVYAEEKSVKGILAGLRQGRTYVTSGPDGPQLVFEADSMRNGRMIDAKATLTPGKPVRVGTAKADVSMGGAVPVGISCDLIIGVLNAQGKKLEVLANGVPICTKIIETNDFSGTIPQNLIGDTAYRVRIIDSGPQAGFGPVQVHAMSSPIYADRFLILPKGMRPEDVRLAVQDKSTPEAGLVNPVYATGVLDEKSGRQVVNIQANPGSAAAPPQPAQGNLPPFSAPGTGELKPRAIQEQR